jgi:hypothetical protein
MRCVKPSWKHCGACNRCFLPSHVCGEFVPSQLCFNCGQPGHKKQDCPSFTVDAAILIKKVGNIFHIASTIIKMHAKFSNIVTRITEGFFFFFEVTSESTNQLFHTELHCLHLTLNVSDVWVICNISSIA